MFTLSVVALTISLIAAMVALGVSIWLRHSEEYQAFRAAEFFADSERKDLRDFVMLVADLRETFERLESGMDD